MWTVIKSVFSRLFSSQLFWWILVALGAIYGIRKFLNLNPRPDVVGYLPEATLPDKSTEFQKWTVEKGLPMVVKLDEYLSTWHFTNVGLEALMYGLTKYTDNQMIFIINNYEQNHYSKRKGTLDKDLKDITYIQIPKSYRDDIVNRITKLKNR